MCIRDRYLPGPLFAVETSSVVVWTSLEACPQLPCTSECQPPIDSVLPGSAFGILNSDLAYKCVCVHEREHEYGAKSLTHTHTHTQSTSCTVQYGYLPFTLLSLPHFIYLLVAGLEGGLGETLQPFALHIQWLGNISWRHNINHAADHCCAHVYIHPMLMLEAHLLHWKIMFASLHCQMCVKEKKNIICMTFVATF